MNKNPRKKKVSKETDPKVLFRRSKVWANFRQKIRKKQKYDYVTTDYMDLYSYQEQPGRCITETDLFNNEFYEN